MAAVLAGMSCIFPLESEPTCYSRQVGICLTSRAKVPEDDSEVAKCNDHIKH